MKPQLKGGGGELAIGPDKLGNGNLIAHRTGFELFGAL
jgi:hypothetical protein